MVIGVLTRVAFLLYIHADPFENHDKGGTLLVTDTVFSMGYGVSFRSEGERLCTCEGKIVGMVTVGSRLKKIRQIGGERKNGNHPRPSDVNSHA